MSDAIGDRKRELRRRMRDVRGSVDDQAERSAIIWSYVCIEPAVRAARSVMAFASVPGEPDSSGFLEWCVEHGKDLVVPTPDRSAEEPADPRSLDVIVVPGLAFTRDGRRLGQGGGWYDRYLAGIRDDCTTIGVAFAAQLCDEIPVDAHDIGVDLVITDAGRVTPG